MRCGLLLVLLIALAGAGCRATGRVVTDPGAPVILISIDTLRADHLPLYGYRAGQTPAIDALGRESVVFENAYSQCPLTLAAHASMLTGLLPPNHGVHDNIGFTLAESHRTLADRFRAAGAHTGGAISAYVLRSQTGIGHGFDFYDDALEMEGGGETMGQVQRDGTIAAASLGHWVEQQGEKRFLAFLHLYEPHSPYTPPERYGKLPTPYDGEVAYADELVGQFLERLKRSGVYDRALIVLTSDHGEALGQHGEAEHGLFLYNESVHVPLLVRLPHGARGGTRVAGAVAQVDIPATILDLAGLDTAGLDGVTLRPALESGQAADRPVYAETLYGRYHFGWSELYSVTDARLRYIRAPRRELYDVVHDPGEMTNLMGARAPAATAMDVWLTGKVNLAEVAAPQEVPAEVREKLQALGYVGGASAPAKGGPEASRPDPKDNIGTYEALRRALGLREANRDAEAVAAFQEVVRQSPAMIDAWEMMGHTLIRLGRTREGIAAIVRALALDPGRATAHVALARVYALEGDTRRAAQHAEIAAPRDPGQAYETLAELMMDKNDLARAAEFARRAVAADKQRVMGHFILGVTAQKAGRYDEALGHFRRAEDAKRLRKQMVVLNLHANMADCLARLGHEPEAEQQFLAEIQAIPTSQAGRVGLAMLYRSQGRDEDARATLGGLITALPQPTPEAYATVVHTLQVLGDTTAAREWAARARSRFPSDPRFGAPPGSSR